MSAHFWYFDDRISPESDDAFTDEEIDEIIELVRESSFLDDESGASIDERMTDVFGGRAPEWSGFQTVEGFCCVNCGGVISADGQSMGVVIQFEIAEDLESFVLSGMLIDGVEQPEGLILQFEEQFATSLWDDDQPDYDDTILPDEYRYDPRSRFADSGYGDWEESALWDSGDFDDDEPDEDEYEEDSCGCGHHHGHNHECGHDHHHHDHCDCEEEEIILRPLDGDDDQDDEEDIGWGDDAAERFWYGSDEDDWVDDGEDE